MKATRYFLLIILMFPLFSFNIYLSRNVQDEKLKGEIPSDILYIKGSRNIIANYMEGIFTVLPPEELAFDGDAIQYFNLITDEIVFIDSLDIDKQTFLMPYLGYNIYLNDKLILDNISFTTGGSSFVINDFIFYYDYIQNKLFLNFGYPTNIYNVWPEESKERCQRERDENFEKRKEGWDIFIQYLRDAGKIIENITSLEPAAIPELNDISIYPNPTTGEFRIENGEWRITNIQIFDIIGNKVNSLAPYSLSSKVDISHLPAGIYFVQITTEKGVVTKKVVKR